MSVHDDSPPPEPQGRRRAASRLVWPAVALVLLAASAALIAAGLGLRHHAARPAAATAADYGRAPAYTLVDQNGARVSSARFAGKVQLVGFLFPYCTTYCPLIARELARLQQALHAAGLDRRTQLVTFNVDPAHAGPRQLRAVMTEFGGDPSSGTWEYLTGSPAQVRAAVTGGFHVYYHRVSLAQERRIAAREKAAGTYTPQPEEPNRVAARAHVRYDVAHDDYLALVDPRGRIVAVLDQASTLTSEALLRDVRAVLAGAPVPGQPVG